MPFTHDIFISYGHLDDLNPFGGGKRLGRICSTSDFWCWWDKPSAMSQTSGVTATILTVIFN